MPHIDEQFQFFPPILKWLSVGFFAVIILSLAFVALNIPRSYELATETNQDLNTDQSTPLIQLQNTTPSSTASANPATNQTVAEGHQSIEPTHDATETNPLSTPAALGMTEQQSGQQTPGSSLEPKVSPKNNTDRANKDCQKPTVKGIIWEGKKWYFKKGVQGYDVIDTLLGASQIHWLCSWRQAEADGWQKAFPGLYPLIKSLLN